MNLPTDKADGANGWKWMNLLTRDLLFPAPASSMSLGALFEGERKLTNYDHYLPLLVADSRYSAHHWGITFCCGMGEYRRVCDFDTREEFINWYNSEYTGETLDDI